jgi:hypothetical protein
MRDLGLGLRPNCNPILAALHLLKPADFHDMIEANCLQARKRVVKSCREGAELHCRQ